MKPYFDGRDGVKGSATPYGLLGRRPDKEPYNSQMPRVCKTTYQHTPQIKAEQHWIVTLMRQYAEQQLCSPISLKEIATLYRKNEKYVGRLFKKETGKSFAEYCNDLRLERAAQLISQGAGSVISVAMECGFNNISYFNRLFRKKYGVSPTAYRKEE